MSYICRLTQGPYASHTNVHLNELNIFTLQLDWSFKSIDIFYENKWSTITNMNELSDKAKELFILAANYTIIHLKGYSGNSDKALIDLQNLL